MDAKKPTITIISPAFNEEEVLPHFYREISQVLESLEDHYAFEILFVDDGSRDGTLQYLRQLARSDSRVRYLSLSRNFGHQAAFTAGLEHATGDAVILMDSDLQHPPALLPTLLERWEEGHEVVVTLREGKRPGLFRNLATKAFLGLMRRLSSMPMRQRMADYCLLSRRALDSLLRLRESHRYLRGMVQWLGYSVAEVPYQPRDRKAGQTKFSMFRLLAYSLDAVVSFSRVPLRLAFIMGLIYMFIGLGVLAGGIVGAFIPSWEISGWTIALLSSIHLVGGTILCSLGLVGEYIGRIFEQVKGRPIYLIQETEEAVVSAETGTRRRSVVA
jgi:dolichol-phosphate mannosyltransferase